MLPSQSDLEALLHLKTGTRIDSATLRQHAEILVAELRISQSRFMTAFKHNTVAMVISTVDEGRILEANDRFLELFGRERADVIGLSSTILEMWADSADRLKVIEILRHEGRVHDFETTICAAGGELRHVLLSVEPLENEPLENEHEACILTGIYDFTHRIQAEEALRESEKRFATLFQSSPVALLISAAVDGRIIDMNTRFLQLFGYTSDSLIGKTTVELGIWISQADRDRVITLLHTNAWNQEVDVILVTAQGEQRHIMASVTPLLVEHELCLLTAFYDLTERVAIEKEHECLHREVREKHALLQMVFDSTPIGLALLEGPDHRYVLVNQAQIQIARGKGPLVGHTVAEIWPEAREHEAQRLLDQVYQTGEAYHVNNLRMVLDRGAGLEEAFFDIDYLPLRNDHEQITGMLLVSTETTEHVQILAREHAALMATQRAIAQINSIQQVTVALGGALTPAAVAEIIGRHIATIFCTTEVSLVVIDEDGAALQFIDVPGYSDKHIPPGTRIALTLNLPLTDVIRTGKPIFIETPDQFDASYPGQRMACYMANEAAWVAIPLHIHGRAIGGLRLAFEHPRKFSDEERAYLLTIAQQGATALERARLYVAEHDARATAEAAVQLREQFLSVAAHELKTPLTGLTGYIQVFQRRSERNGTLTEQERQILQRILHQSDRLNYMINALLDVSRIDAGRLKLELSTLDLVSLLASMVAELQLSAPNHELVLQNDQTELWIPGDALRLEQVFRNLIENAIKYSPGSGRVTVIISSDATHARVAVQDQGIGISAADLPQLFERFYRSSNTNVHSINGIGIGLYVVQEIVALHHGSVEVESQEGVGSTFTVILPC